MDSEPRVGCWRRQPWAKFFNRAAVMEAEAFRFFGAAGRQLAALDLPATRVVWLFAFFAVILSAISQGRSARALSLGAKPLMWWLVWIVLAIVVAALLEIPRYRAVRPYHQRGCAGVRWRRQFHEAAPQEIREFLQLFVDSFGFRSKHRLRFRPDDKLLNLYQALNPPNWSMGDSCEFECLFEELQARYHVDLAPLYREDLTLGDVFSFTRPA